MNLTKQRFLDGIPGPKRAGALAELRKRGAAVRDEVGRRLANLASSDDNEPRTDDVVVEAALRVVTITRESRPDLTPVQALDVVFAALAE